MERFEALGLITRRYRLTPGTTLPCTVAADDVYALTIYEVDVRGATRLDLIRGDVRLQNVPFDAGTGRVYMLTSAEYLRTLPSMTIALRLIAVEPGGERNLGEFRLEHTAYMQKV